MIQKGISNGKLKLLDIDPMELARQLTVIESSLYRKITAIECLLRCKNSKVVDHIADIIQLSNKVNRSLALLNMCAHPMTDCALGQLDHPW